MSGLSIRAKYKHFKTIWEHTFGNAPNDSSSSFLNIWSSKQGFETMYSCCLFVRQCTISFHAFSSMSFHVARPRHRLSVRFSPPWPFFSCSSRNSWFEHFSVFLNNCFVRFTFTLSASQVYVIKKWNWFVKINIFHQFVSSTWDPYSVSFQPFLSHPRIPIRIILFHGERRSIPNWKPFPNRTSIGFSQNCLSHKSCQRMTVQIRSRGTTGSSILDHEFGHVCRGRRIHKSWHYILPGCKRISRRLLVRHSLVFF